MKAPKMNYNGNTGIAEGHNHVVIMDKNSTLKADYGTYSTKTLIADFKGNVVIDDDTVNIKSDSIRYYKNTQYSIAIGNTKVEDDSSIVFCDHLEYDRKKKSSYCYDDVYIFGKYNNTILTADTVINIPEEEYSIAYGHTIIYKIDSANQSSNTIEKKNDNNEAQSISLDTLTISCDTIQIKKNDTTEVYLFNGNLEIVQSNITSKSTNGVYYKQKDFFLLLGTPIVWFDSTQLHGDSIYVFIPQNKIDKIHSVGNAIAMMINDTIDITRKDQISGDTINIYFRNDTINALAGLKNAKSLYFLSSDSTADGLARHSCDSLFIEFSNNQPTIIHWLGAVQGEVYPEKMINSNPINFYLPSYRWNETRPKRKMLRIKENILVQFKRINSYK